MDKKKTKRRARAKSVRKKPKNRKISDLRLLELLINEFIEKLEKNGFELRVQDVLKAIQLKQKLAQTSEAEKIFWELIDQLRKEELTPQ
jgi:translation elongation factor EF-Tu-like GTPase